MATNITTPDTLPTTGSEQFNTAWDWKGSYVSDIANSGDGLERFSQFSATPDSTILYAGPARFSGLSGDASILVPIGMADGISIQTNPALARLFEIGSNRSFFTRGKTASSLSLSRMLCDQKNLLAALTQVAYRPVTSPPEGGAAPNQDVMMNLDSEYFSVPFGLMMLFKTRGGGVSGEGKVLAAIYLEYAMIANYGFQIASSSPVIAESVAIEFDRILPISMG